MSRLFLALILFFLAIFPSVSTVLADTGTTIDQLNELKTDFSSDKMTVNSQSDPSKYLFIQVQSQDKTETFQTNLDDKVGVSFTQVKISDPNDSSKSVSLPVNSLSSFSNLRGPGFGFILTPPEISAPTLPQIGMPELPSINLGSVPKEAWIWISSKIQSQQPLNIELDRQATGISDNGKIAVPVNEVFDKLTKSQENSSIQCPIGPDGKQTNCLNDIQSSLNDLVKLQQVPITTSSLPKILPLPATLPIQAAIIPPMQSADGKVENPGKNVSAGGEPCPINEAEKLLKTTSGVMTAIGCVPTQPKPLIEGILKFSAAIGGGIAFLLMISGVFQFITSAGNQDSLKKASEQITNSVIGLLFIIFSVLLLRIIGVDILGILPP